MEYIGWKIGQELRNLRKENEMTLDELSSKVEMSTSHINQIELGSRKITTSLLFKLMTVLNVDANTILGIQKKNGGEQVSIDAMLMELPKDIRDDLADSFQYMINKFSKNAS